MRTIVRAQESCAFSSACIAAACMIAAGATPAAAETPGVPPGSIVIARDVPIHNAFVPQDPGTPSYVRTVPGPDIFGSTIHNLVPLGDGEFAEVTSSPDPAARGVGVPNPDMVGRTELLQRSGSDGAFAANAHGSGGGVINGAIGAGMSALNQGLGALGSALSGGQK